MAVNDNILDTSTEIRSRKMRRVGNRIYQTRIYATVVTLAQLEAQAPVSGSPALDWTGTVLVASWLTEEVQIVEDFDVAGRHAIIVVYSQPVARGDPY